MLLAILFQFSVATVVIIGDSVERFMLHAAAHEGLNPACRSERPVIPHSAISTMACGDFFFMHNRFDIATKGPLHRFGSVFEGRPVQQADLLLAMKAAPDNVTRVQLAVNFWTLARLRSHHRPTLLSMETSNAVALTFRAGLNHLMATVERRYPNAAYGWSERYRCAATQSRNDYYFGDRVLQLNRHGTSVARRRGWDVFETHNQTVPLRDNMHPTDKVLVAMFKEIFRRDSQDGSQFRQGLAPICRRFGCGKECSENKGCGWSKKWNECRPGKSTPPREMTMGVCAGAMVGGAMVEGG